MRVLYGIKEKHHTQRELRYGAARVLKLEPELLYFTISA